MGKRARRKPAGVQPIERATVRVERDDGTPVADVSAPVQPGETLADAERRLSELTRAQLIVQSTDAADERAAAAVRARQAQRLGRAVGGMLRAPLSSELFVPGTLAGEPVQVPIGQRLEQIDAELRRLSPIESAHAELLAERAKLRQLVSDTGRRRARAVREYIDRLAEVTRNGRK